MAAMAREHSSTLDREEVARFARLGGEWWDANGPFKPLHRLNPVRLTYIRDRLCAKFGRDPKAARSLSGLSVLDIGCGGGLVSEPFDPARRRASPASIRARRRSAAARAHAEAGGLGIRYEAATAEQLVARGDRATTRCCCSKSSSTCRTCRPFSKAVAPLVKPDGLMVLSTLNRTLKSYALAIVGAEYILRWIPIGTHQWDRFVTPGELRAALRGAGLSLTDTTGLIYDPFADEWRLSSDTDVNYFATAVWG